MAMAEEQSVDERVRTAQVEARARNISHNVRCLECGHQSIEESAADIAVRLRKVVHTNDLQLLALLWRIERNLLEGNTSWGLESVMCRKEYQLVSDVKFLNRKW